MRSPGGSTLVSADAIGLPSSQHHDTVRALLVFARDGFVYTLGSATGQDALEPDLALTPERIEGYEQTLDAMRASMRFAATR